MNWKLRLLISCLPLRPALSRSTKLNCLPQLKQATKASSSAHWVTVTSQTWLLPLVLSWLNLKYCCQKAQCVR